MRTVGRDSNVWYLDISTDSKGIISYFDFRKGVHHCRCSAKNCARRTAFRYGMHKLKFIFVEHGASRLTAVHR